MKVRWSETAVSELEALFINIRTQNLTSAKNVAARIVDRGESLGLFPLAGVPFRPSGRRKLTVVNYPLRDLLQDKFGRQ